MSRCICLYIHLGMPLMYGFFIVCVCIYIYVCVCVCVCVIDKFTMHSRTNAHINEHTCINSYFLCNSPHLRYLLYLTVQYP